MSGSRTNDDPRTGAKRERRAAAKAERDRLARRARVATRTRRWALGLVAVVAIGAAGFKVVRTGAGGVTFAGDLRVGGTLEALRLPQLEGGGTVSYAVYDERPLVINFFASWCPNCIAEMPDFERVHQRLGDQVAFLGVSQSDHPQASIDLAHETGITYETAIDERGAFFNALGARGMPTTVFVLPGGQIADIWVGGLNAGTLEQLVAEHFGVSA